MAEQLIVDQAFTGVRDFTNADRVVVARVVFEIKGMAAAGASCTPQIRFTQGSGTYYDKTYSNHATEVSVSSGTAITADGIYEGICDASILALNVTVAGSGPWSVYFTPLAG